MRRRGFTVIEVMVVLAIIGILLCLFLPAVLASRGASQRIQCSNNLRQLCLGLLNYHAEHEVFPPGYSPRSKNAISGWGWIAGMLPNIEQNFLSTMIDPGVPMESAAHRTVRVTRISTTVCPTDIARDNHTRLTVNAGGTIPCELAASSYVASFGTGDPNDPAQTGRGDGVFFRNSRISLHQIMDGTSTTFLLGERARASGPSTWNGAAGDNGPALVLGSTGGDPGPNAMPRRPTQFSSRHDGGAYFGFGDGSVRFVKSNVGAAIYAALATRNGEDVVPGLDD